MTLKEIGEQLKNYRLNILNMTIREFCIKYNLDAVTYSKIERGIIDKNINRGMI